MAVQVKIGAGAKKAFIAEIVTLPATVTLRGNNQQLFPKIMIGVIFTVISYFIFTNSAKAEGLVSMPVAISLLFAGVGSYNIAKAIIAFTSLTKMTFHDEFVEVSEKKGFRKHQWRENYENYQGLRHREKSPKSFLGSQIPYQIIELIHEDESKTLPLYAVKSSDYPLNHMEHYADILEVEIVDNDIPPS